MPNRKSFPDIIADYVSEQRALGYKYLKKERMLRNITELYYEMGYSDPILDKALVLKWTEKKQHESECNRGHRISAVRGLAEYMTRLGYIAYQYPKRFGPHWQSNYSPYIFSDREIASILLQVDNCEPNAASPFRHLSLPLLFRLLYGSGLRISEALSLTKDDVDLDEGILFVKQTKFGKERLVPLSKSLHDRCKKYSAEMRTYPIGEKSPYFIPAPHGGKYSEGVAYVYFRKFLWEAGISHGGRGKGPRLHDLRHTYSVHCLRNLVKSGADLHATLPYLSAYLGHSGMRGTQHYLRLTAEHYPYIVMKVEDQFSWILPEVNV